MTEIEKMKRQLAVLGAIEQGGGDISGTSVDQVIPADLEVAAPPPSRVPLQPKVVQVPGTAGDDELAGAKDSDVDAFNDRATETALRQIVAGITRTKAPDSVNQLGTAEKDLVSARRQHQLDALRQMEAGNNARRTDAYLEAQGKQGELGEKKLAAAAVETDRRSAREQAQDALRERAQTETERHNKEAEKTNRITANKPRGPTVVLGADGKPVPSTFRDQQRADALKPRQGWEPIDAAAPTFRDPAQAKAFDTSVASMGAIRNHRDHVLHELEALKKAKTPGEVDIAVGRLNAQMGALASKLRDAEGLNNTDAANHAIETMLSLQNGSAVNWKNVLNEGRLPAIINAAISSGEANLDTIAESNNLRRSKGGAPAAGGHEQAAAGQSVITLIDENGEELDVDAGKAEALLAKHKNLRRK